MATDDSSPSRIRAVTALVIIGTFLLGTAVGAGLYHWRTPGRPPLPPAPVFHMLAELGLSASQQQRAQEIRERHEPELKAIFLESFPKMRAVHAKMEEELRAILTPEQQKKLDELTKLRPFRMGLGPPPPFPPPPGQSAPLYSPPPPPAAPRN